ncbi:uncharacterized protein [Temnothorax longispinosus]
MEDHHYFEFNNTYCTDNEVSNENNISIEEKDSDAFLIELYRERPFLYNKGHKDFKNIIIKDNAWKEISKIMQNKNYGNLYTPDYCQTRCTSLRNQYNREKRIIDSQYKSGSGASTHKPFAFYTQLSFLDNYIKRRRTCSNIKPNKASTSTSSLELSTKIPKFTSNEVFDTKEKSSHSMHETEDNNFNGENNKENILEDTRETHVTHKRNIDKDSPSVVLHTKPKSKKSKVDETKELDNMFTSVSQKIMNVLDNKRENNNEDEAFAQFIVAHLTNLPQSEKNIRKKMITDALFSSL